MAAVKRGRVETERGSVAIEAAILVPAFIAIVALVIAFGRIQTVQGTVTEATRDAARAASMAPPAGAETAGVQAARATLSGAGLNCPDPTLQTNFGSGVGRAGTVTATINCTVGLTTILWAGVPGSVEISSSFTAVVDSYRSQQ
ncbi:TadE/TadG family type IV pilus assembly protein [Streptacidiphilus sp. P02-A3a]|uniref:TadE/TadG family type IV pilus assembly protein n=1 Tax=Streptacidiphilus sp. P02-A3a TaxID=2704468 RepID=UPI0015F8CC7E|nr:TadE/TadG family type IV pilus assembly protein [Streptacidiphilus sp. P02-A3a]QMU68876.1 pilus assembly protein [Streptacidiphilus sp. P02-A3a]